MVNPEQPKPISDFPPDFDGQIYIESIRKSLGIQNEETGATVREKLRPLWEESRDHPGIDETRWSIMEVLFGDRVGSEFSGLGAFTLHITAPQSYDDFLNMVPSAAMWREQDLAALRKHE